MGFGHLAPGENHRKNRFFVVFRTVRYILLCNLTKIGSVY